MLPFLLSTALGAFLLFQVQPLAGRTILPWFGGGPSVWTACLLFFQAVLALGYGYAHLLARLQRPRLEAALHSGVLALSLMALPILSGAEQWNQVGEADPTARVLLLLLFAVGLPYGALAATTPLVTRWFHRTLPQRSAYRLYALSNAASLAALISYPFVVEPLLGVRQQALVWSGIYAGFIIVCGWAAWSAAGSAESSSQPTNDGTPSSTGDMLFWMALAACGSALLTATTNQLSQEVAVVPFLWVLPLTIYLLSFILTFESERWYRRRLFGFLLAAAAPIACGAMAVGGILPLEVQALIYCGALFVATMACHGELAASRPPASRSTYFYLTIAVGGALGGASVAVAAPALFSGYWEFPLAFAGACLLTLIGWKRSRHWGFSAGLAAALRGAPAGLLIALATVGYALSAIADEPAIAVYRNFYGVLRVVEREDDLGPLRAMRHGSTDHGSQYLDEALRGRPTMYFGAGTGAALVFEHLQRPRDRGLRVGIVGLGAGTLAAYSKPGDTVRFFEINPDVVSAAREYFTFLSDAQGETSVAVGDARILLEAEVREADRPRYDVLVVDAFSSGSIPIHLLTAEAAGLYASRLAPDGVLVLHVTNRFLDLEPVTRGIAETLAAEAVRVSTPADPSRGVSQATWMILSSNTALLNAPEIASHRSTGKQRVLRWSDDYSALWRALR